MSVYAIIHMYFNVIDFVTYKLYKYNNRCEKWWEDWIVACVLRTRTGSRRVWRYQRGNQNAQIEEEQTTQWPKKKYKQRSTKHTHKTKDRVTRTPLKTGGEIRCFGRVSSSCSASDTHGVNLLLIHIHFIIHRNSVFCISASINCYATMISNTRLTSSLNTILWIKVEVKVNRTMVQLPVEI